MPHRTEAIEAAVIAAIDAVSPDRSLQITRSSEVLRIMSSLEFMMVLAYIQEALDVLLQPRDLLEIFKCLSVADVAAVFGDVMSRDEESG